MSDLTTAISAANQALRKAFANGDAQGMASLYPEVVVGPVDVEFIGDDGSSASASVGEGQKITFDGSSFTFDVPESNSEPVVVHFDGAAFELEPGESAAIAQIDIKPGNQGNPVNIRSRGVLPVALMSTPLLDATTVDANTLTFGPGGAGPSHPGGHLKDIDEDGDLDLLLHFAIPDVGLASDATRACLVGETAAVPRLEACDAIKIVERR